tara:strand:+ start:228 stop:1514 length:1287 start_codon:yes stop_codon:yes gene_type:complete
MIDKNQIYKFVKDLFPICRSITGQGLRDSLDYIKDIIPGLLINSVESGTQVFDWIVPDEWVIHGAYIEDENGEKVIDFDNNNLHLMGYSEPVDKWLSLDELKEYLHFLTDQPNAIPYVTSYYERRWGFCITYEQYKKLKPGKYHVVINTELKPGILNYGELILKGESNKEIFLSTYLCHPSMANNELSGPAVTTYLAKWLSEKKRKYTYRIIFIPETIGSITYLSKNLDEMKKNIIAGFNITCVGDNMNYSFLPSIKGNTLADKVGLHVLENLGLPYTKYSFLDRGSDERQYCSPGVDLPVVSLMRTKYGSFPEYHTSLDNLEFISPDGLQGGFDVLKKCLECIEINTTYKSTVLCEPQLGKRGLYPTISRVEKNLDVKNTIDLLAYSDGKRTLLEIADIIKLPIWKLSPIINILKKKNLLKEVKTSI